MHKESEKYSVLTFAYREHPASIPIASSISDLTELVKTRLLPTLEESKKIAERVEVGVSKYHYRNESEATVSFLVDLVEKYGKPTKKAHAVTDKESDFDHRVYPNHLISEMTKTPWYGVEGFLSGPFEEHTYIIGPVMVGQIPQNEWTNLNLENLDKLARATTLVVNGAIAVDGITLLGALEARPQKMTAGHILTILRSVVPEVF